MKKTLLPLLIVLLPLAASAQTEGTDETDFQTRLSIGLDKKISKGFHITAEEQFRFEDGSSAIDRFQTSLGVSYKISDFLKAGFTYSLLNPYKKSQSAFTYPRHRFSFELGGTWKTGLWTFGIKERFQITHRTGEFNTYQSATNAMVLKSRISAKYRGFSFGKPYAYAEVRNTLNAPAIKANYNAALDPPYYSADGSSDAGWFIDSWSNMYVNRLRGCLGCDFELSKSHGIDVYVLTEYCTDKSVDANKEGTKLKSYTLDHSLNFILGVGYTYSF